MDAGQSALASIDLARAKATKRSRRPLRILLLVAVNAAALTILGGAFYERHISPTRALVADVLEAARPAVYRRVVADSENEARRAQELRTLVEKRFDASSPARGAYAATDYRPFFFGTDGAPAKAADGFLARLASLDLDGIDPAPYGVEDLRQRLAELAARRDAIETSCDISLSAPERWVLAAGLRRMTKEGPMPPAEEAARTLLLGEGGEFVPYPSVWMKLRSLRGEQRDLLFSEQVAEVDLAAGFLRLARDLGQTGDAAVAEALQLVPADLDAALRRIEPNLPIYRALRAGLARYRKLRAEVGEFVPVAWNGKKMELGASGEEVGTLQTRLAQEGFFDGPPTYIFDEKTKNALARFQARHGLLDDGVLGERTVRMLNLSLAEKVLRLEAEIRNLRQAAWRGEDFFVRVNIPQFRLDVVQDGKIVRTHKVIVGDRDMIKLNPANPKEIPRRHNATPRLSAAIQTVIFNPRWYVPPRIKKELDRGEIARDPHYLEKNHFIVVRDEHGRERYYQDSGDDNALGQVKILFPNRYSVYMHDTPTRHLFGRVHRDFSHGCIRVDQAMDLAKYLLTRDLGGKTEAVERLSAKRKKPVPVSLKRAVPIHIDYATVSADEQGNVQFFEDLYELGPAGDPAPPPG